MKPDVLKDLILSLNQDVVFTFEDKTVCINPYNENKFEVGYGDTVKTYTDIDALMTDLFYDGKSLNDISESIVLEA